MDYCATIKIGKKKNDIALSGREEEPVDTVGISSLEQENLE